MKVWMRPMGTGCKIRVDSRDDANMLGARLTDQGATCTDPVSVAGTFGCVFYISKPTEPSQVQGLLKAIPEVELMLDPA